MRRKNVTILAYIILLLTAGISYADLADGLVAHWSFNDPTNPGFDSSGNGNNGTVYGGTPTEDRNGSPDMAYSLFTNGNYWVADDEYIDIPDSPSLNVSPNISIASWVIFLDLSYNHRIILWKHDATVAHLNPSYGLSSGPDEFENEVVFTFGHNSWEKTTGFNLQQGVWTHIAITFDDSSDNLKFYKNGTLHETISTAKTIGINNASLFIGGYKYQDGYLYSQGPGPIDDIRIYNRALTADEVSQLFNQQPVANAGDDKISYACVDETVEVTLDGSGSYDPDGDPLTYSWTWDGESASGSSPTIELPVGVHVIELIVNDGMEDSEPDEVIISVVEPMEAQLCILPATIHRHRGFPEITAVVRLPEGITKEQIDIDQPLLLYPGGIEATCQGAIQWCSWGTPRTSIIAFFDKAELMNAVPDDGCVELFVVGQLNTGQYFYGSDFVRIFDWFWWRPLG